MKKTFILFFLCSSLFGYAQNMEAEYQKSRNIGDACFQKANYPCAMQAYYRAWSIRETDSYVAERYKLSKQRSLIKIEKKIVTKTYSIVNRPKVEFESEKSTADQCFNQKNYACALEHYQQAIRVNTIDEYCRNQLKIVEKLLDNTNQVSSKEQMLFDSLKQEGIRLFVKQTYLLSASKFKEALAIKKSAFAYQMVILAEKEQQSAINFYVSQGDSCLNLEQYPCAMSAYLEGLKFDDKDTTLINRKADLDTLNLYVQHKEIADSLFTAQNIPRAFLNYQKALKFKKTDEYVSNKIEEIEQIVENGVLANRIKIQADSCYMKEQLDTALVFYKQVLKLKERDIDSENKIFTLELKLKEQTLSKNLIMRADSATKNFDFELAIQLYQEANTLNPNDYCVQQEQIVQQKNISFMQAKAGGTMCMEKENWDCAKLQFKTALDVKPIDVFCQEKLKEVEIKLIPVGKKKK